MRNFLLLVALASVAYAGSFGVPKEMMEGIKHWSFLTACWGKENMDTYDAAVKAKLKECQEMPTKYSKEDLFGKSGVCGVRKEEKLSSYPLVVVIHMFIK